MAPPPSEPSAVSAQELIIRGITALEGTTARFAAVEKSVDGLHGELRTLQQSFSRLDDYLVRLARAEERREKREDAAQKQRGEIMRDTLGSPWFQHLMSALLGATLAALGIPAMKSLAPQPAHPEVVHAETP